MSRFSLGLLLNKRVSILNRLLFYTSLGCHLCEHAELVLQDFSAQPNAPQFELEEVDISTDENLVELYGIRIPVLKNALNEKEVGWPFSVEDIASLF